MTNPKDESKSDPHRSNVNPHAQSEESAHKLGEVETGSINEPGPDDPKPFKVPADHTATTPETLKRDYPDIKHMREEAKASQEEAKAHHPPPPDESSKLKKGK